MDIAALVNEYIKDHPEIFIDGQLSVFPQLVQFDGTLRKSTQKEYDILSKYIPRDRLVSLLLDKNIGGISDLLFPRDTVVSNKSVKRYSPVENQANLAIKSLKRKSTVFCHQYFSEETQAVEPSPVFSVKIWNSHIFTGADDWLVKKFKLENLSELVSVYHGHQGVITDLLFWSNTKSSIKFKGKPFKNSIMASLSGPDKTVRVWLIDDADDDDDQEEHCICFVRYISEPNTAVFTKDYLIVALESSEIHVHPVNSLFTSGERSPGQIYEGRGTRVIFPSLERIRLKAFGYFETTDEFFISTSEKQLRIYNTSSCNLVQNIEYGKFHGNKFIVHIACSQSHSVATACESGSIILWENDTGSNSGKKWKIKKELLSPGDLKVANGEKLKDILKRLSEEVRRKNLFFNVDTMAFIDQKILVASVSVAENRSEQSTSPLMTSVLAFDCDDGRIIGISEDFSDRIFAIKEFTKGGFVVGSYDGHVAFFRYGEAGLLEINRFVGSRTENRKILDVCVSLKYCGRGLKQRPFVQDVFVGLSDDLGCVSMLGLGGEEEECKIKDCFFIDDYEATDVERSTSTVTVASVLGFPCDRSGVADSSRIEKAPQLSYIGASYNSRSFPEKFSEFRLPLVEEAAGDQRHDQLIVIEQMIDVMHEYVSDNESSSDSSISEARHSLLDEDEETESTSEDEDDENGRGYLRRQASIDARQRLRRTSRRILRRGRRSSLDRAPQESRRSLRLRNLPAPELELPPEPSPVDSVDFWLACDHCGKWRRVSEDMHSQYDGTDKVVRCRRIGRNCDDPSDEPAASTSDPIIPDIQETILPATTPRNNVPASPARRSSRTTVRRRILESTDSDPSDSSEMLGSRRSLRRSRSTVSNLSETPPRRSQRFRPN
jgi:hypothetical protein